MPFVNRLVDSVSLRGASRAAACRLILVVVLVAVALSLAACWPGLEEQPRVLMIGIEGVNWDLLQAMMRAGEAPNFSRLRREGAWGVLESEAPIPAAGYWVTVATGRTDAEHHVIKPIRYDSTTHRLMFAERAVSSVWEILTNNHISAGVIGWPGSAPIPPPVKGGVDEFALYRGLGAKADVDGAVWPVGPVPDDFPGFAMRVPAGGELNARLTAASFSSAPKVAREIWPQVRFLAVYLEGLNTPRHFAGIAPANGEKLVRPAYGKPSRQHVRRLDRVLGELLELATPTTMVLVATRDAAAGHGRGGVEDYSHHINGAVAVLGPGVVAGRRMENPTVLDFAPLALVYLGLPLSEQMPGNPFDEAWKQKPSLQPRLASHDVFIRRPYPEETPLENRRAIARVAKTRAAAGAHGRPFNVRNRYALELLAGGKLQGATGEASRDLENDAANPVSQYLFGEIRLAQGRAEEALLHFKKAADRLGDAPESNAERELRTVIAMAQATAYLDLGVPPSAAASLRPALALCAGCAPPIVLLAETHLADSEQRHAAAVAQAALDRGVSHPDLWLVLGRARRALGDNDGARAAFEKAIDDAKQPRAEVHRELGLVETASANWSQAARSLRTATQADSSDVMAWLYLAQAYRQLGQQAEEEGALKACLKADPENVDAWMAWRQLWRSQGDHDTADRLLSAARAGIATKVVEF